MQALPLKQYTKLAKALASKGYTAEKLFEELTASHSFMMINGKRIKVSKTRLTAMLPSRVQSLIERIRDEVRTGVISQRVLIREYTNLKEEGLLCD